MEVWKKIEESDYYWISSYGRVWSTYGKGRMLKQTLNNNYLGVSLGRNKRVNIHRLVATYFCENENNYDIVNHIDEDKLNNKAENLEWCSVQYNNTYNNIRDKAGITRGKVIEQYDLSGKFISEFPSATQISKILGYSQSNISACCRGLRPTAHGYIWKFKNKGEK